MLRALFFDLDNTLLDRATVFKRYAVSQLERLSIPHDSREMVFNKLVACDRAHQHCELLDYAEHMATGVPELGMGMQAFYAEYIPGLLAAIQPEAEVCGMLNRLSRTWKIAVVTNGGSERQREKLQRTGIEKCVAPDAIFVSGEIGAPKPKPLIFSRALAWAECEAVEALFIGDDPERDVGGASALGMATCWVYGTRARDHYPDGYPRPDWSIERVCDLENMLPRIISEKAAAK